MSTPDESDEDEQDGRHGFEDQELLRQVLAHYLGY